MLTAARVISAAANSQCFEGFYAFRDCPARLPDAVGKFAYRYRFLLTGLHILQHDACGSPL